MSDSYLVPFEDATDSFVEKKSEFIGHIFKVESPEEAIAKIKEVKEKNRTAVHNVFAYIIRDNNIMRYSDDGEPQGTAGMPVLEVLRREGVTNVCCVVTRYFGGILLGAGGLVRAYAKGAKIALDAAGIAKMDNYTVISIKLPYNLLGIVQTLLPSHECTTEDIEYAEDIKITAFLKSGTEEKLRIDLMEATSGTVDFKILETKFMCVKK